MTWRPINREHICYSGIPCTCTEEIPETTGGTTREARHLNGADVGREIHDELALDGRTWHRITGIHHHEDGTVKIHLAELDDPPTHGHAFIVDARTVVTVRGRDA